MMAELIEMKKGLFRDFLDIGTGSGILSLIASQCLAQEIWALDIDKEAIKTACMIANSGDIILVAGKGHENYQEIKGKRFHFNDKEIIAEQFMLNNLNLQ